MDLVTVAKNLNTYSYLSDKGFLQCSLDFNAMVGLRFHSS
jgi:hypothetical protein